MQTRPTQVCSYTYEYTYTSHTYKCQEINCIQPCHPVNVIILFAHSTYPFDFLINEYYRWFILFLFISSPFIPLFSFLPKLLSSQISFCSRGAAPW